MFTHINIVLYKELLQLAIRVQKNPSHYANILFDNNGELKPCVKRPVNFVALEAIFKAVDADARKKIVDKIESGHFNKFLTTSYLLNEFICHFPLLASVIKIKVYLGKNEYPVSVGDTLSSIAFKLYGDADYARLIAFANDLDDAKLKVALPVGLILTIPSLNTSHTSRPLVFKRHYDQDGRVIAEINSVEKKEYTYNYCGRLFSQCTTPSQLTQEVSLKAWLCMPEFLSKLWSCEEKNKIFIYDYNALGEHLGGTVVEKVKESESGDNYSMLTSSSVLFDCIKPSFSFENIVSLVYLIEYANEKAKLALKLINHFIEAHESRKQPSLYIFINEVCVFYLFPLQELSLDNVKGLIYALQKCNDPCGNLLIAYLLQQAANIYSLEPDCNTKTLKFMLLDAMQYATTGLKDSSTQCQQFSKELLSDIFAVYGDQFEKIRIFYSKIQFMRGENIFENVFPASKSFRKKAESHYKFFIESVMPDINASKREKECVSQALIIYNPMVSRLI